MRSMNIVGAAIVVVCATVAWPLNATSAGVTCCETQQDCPEDQQCCYGRLPCAPSGEAYCVPVDDPCDIDTE